MKMMNPMLIVSNIDKAVEFYRNVLGLQIELDFGANKTLTGGLALQALDLYKEFIGSDTIVFGGNDAEIYFEEQNFDTFVERLKTLEIDYVHLPIEHIWGQRVVRFYDLDKHIIEVGENMKAVCKRFIESGMTPEQVAERIYGPVEYVYECLK